MQLNKSAEKPTLLKQLSPEIRSRICKALNHTWDVIGYDCLQATLDYGGKDNMSRNDVIEVVLDADHPTTHGGDNEAIKILNTLSYNDKIKIAKEAFIFARYGM